MTRTLVAYYSRSGNTQALARELGAALGADVEEIVEPRHRRGPIGYLRSLFDVFTDRLPPVAVPHHDPARYDLVLLGGPVWAGHIASPLRSFAGRYAADAVQVAFFCTEGGKGAEHAFAELRKTCGRAPKATLVVDAEHLAPEKHREAVKDFARQLKGGAVH
jgi:flavodoxin